MLNSNITNIKLPVAKEYSGTMTVPAGGINGTWIGTYAPKGYKIASYSLLNSGVGYVDAGVASFSGEGTTYIIFKSNHTAELTVNFILSVIYMPI
mgnify:CR=1 FL=1